MINESILKNLSCLDCQKQGELVVSAQNIICDNCKKKYPFINNEIPVLIKDSVTLLAQTFKEYCAYISQQNFLTNRLKDPAIKSSYRSLETRKTISDAIDVNTNLIKEIKNKISSHVVTEAAVNMETSHTLHYLSNFDYIRRDWSGEEGTEFEISTIKKTIESFIKSELRHNDNAVFLGTGSGRIAWELKDNFDITYSLDNSLTMISMFYEVLKSDVTLYEINHKNALTNGNICNPFTASLKSSKITDVHNYFCFVGDAIDLPFTDNSICNIFSIYFTDLLPLKILIPEIKRKLKPNGVFYHFGPLHYHFNEIEEMLTAEEIKHAFEKEGFEIILEDSILLSHHQSAISLSEKSYNNWIFAVRKLPEVVIEANLDTVLKLDKGLEYMVSGQINGENDSINYKLILPSKELFSGSELILEITRRVDGIKSLGIIISEVESEYDFEIDNHQDLLFMITSMIKAEVFIVLT